MRAVRVTRFGGPEVLALEELDEVRPGPGEVVVEVAAAGVNFIDVYQREGLYPLQTPFVAGSEGAGRVVDLGDGVHTLSVGDRVAWLMVPGAGYAERVVVPAERCVPVPDEMEDADAAAVMLQGVTVDYLTRSTYAVAPGDDVLVHAAAGGTGLLLTQAATALGARVIGTASTEQKCRAAEAAGARATIDYADDDVDVAAEVRRLTDGRGVHVVYDGVGAPTRQASLDSLRRRGTYVLFGQAGGPPEPVSGSDLSKRGSLYFTRPTVVDHVVERDELLERTARVFSAVRDATLVVTVGATFPLAAAADAQRLLQGRGSVGKILIDPRR